MGAGKAHAGRGRRRRAAMAAAAAMLAAGVLMLAAPAVNGLLYRAEVSAMREAFPAQAGQAGEGGAALDAEGLYAHLVAENARLAGEGQAGLADALSYRQPAVDLSEWGLADNCIGFVGIPSIGVELPVYLGAEAAQMERGAVHLTQTSYPVGGTDANAVIAAHRGVWDGREMFRDIHEVAVGDEVVVENFREVLRYRVCATGIIAPDDMDRVLIQEGRDMVTLVTCNPLWDSYERYVVYCERA